MKKVFLISICLLNHLILNAQSNLKAFCDSLANQYLNQKTGSIVIGIYNNGIKNIFYYGEIEKGSGIKPDSNSVFELGNLTETFTSILFADQIIKGNIHEDDKLNSFLPVEVTAPVFQNMICAPYKSESEIPSGNSTEDNMHVAFTPYTCRPDSSSKPQPILMCYLGTHTSGLPNKPSNFHRKDKSNPYADYSTEDMYEFLRNYHLESPIGIDYKHSDLGIAVLAKALSFKLGKEFEELLVENIFDSLQMNNTRFVLNSLQKEKLVTGYSAKGKKANYWTSDVYSPVVGLHSSPGNMMLFLSANISTQKNNLNNVLDFTHNSRIKTGKFLSPGLEIGLGWNITPTADLQNIIVWKNGSTGGFASYTGFIEANHIGVFILSSISKDVDNLGTSILQSFQEINY